MDDLIRTVSVEVMRVSDAWTIENLVSSRELMRRAGEGIYRAAQWKAPVGIICGKGNNAGDGFVVASLLNEACIACDIILLADSFSDDGRYYYDICVERGICSRTFEPGMDLSVYGSILDCIFGTGFSGEPRGIYAAAIDSVNKSGAYVVSADINSGLNGNSGLGVKYVVSDLTVSIGDFKTGHFTGLSYGAMRSKVNVDIGIQIQGSFDLVREPDLIVLVDLESGKEKHFHDAESFAAMDDAFAGLDYFARTARYAAEYVIEEDREMFQNTMALENIRSTVSKGTPISLKYRACLDGTIQDMETCYAPYRAGLEGINLAIKTVRRI